MSFLYFQHQLLIAKLQFIGYLIGVISVRIKNGIVVLFLSCQTGTRWSASYRFIGDMQRQRCSYKHLQLPRFVQFAFCARFEMFVSSLLLGGLFYHHPLVAVPLIALVALLYWLVKHNYKFWEIDGVPYPKPSLLTGNLGPSLALKKHISELASDWYK